MVSYRQNLYLAARVWDTEVLDDVFCNLRVVNEEGYLVGCDGEVGEKDRVVWDVRPSEVEEPRNLVQAGED